MVNNLKKRCIKRELQRNPWPILARSCFPWTNDWKTVEMNKFVVHGTFLQMKITSIICQKKNTFTKNSWWISLNKSGNDTQPLGKRCDFKQALSSLTFTPTSWKRPARAHSLLEVQTMETSMEYFLYLVAMARNLVVFLKNSQKVKKEEASKGLWSIGATRCLQNFGENLRRMAFKNSFYFVTARSFTADGGLL